MLKILINESDEMFHCGMRYFLMELFKRHFKRTPKFLSGYTEDNIAVADVIVLSLCKGERYTCFPELRCRRQGIIIGLVDELKGIERSPSCFEDIVYVMRSASLSEMTTKITFAWRRWLLNEGFPYYKTCFGCKHFILSLQQQKIMDELAQGHSAQEVATNLHISYKTVASHKYFVMRKFSLKNDYDLFRFLGMLGNKSKLEYPFEPSHKNVNAEMDENGTLRLKMNKNI